jgi:aldose 1-epimerase
MQLAMRRLRTSYALLAAGVLIAAAILLALSGVAAAHGRHHARHWTNHGGHGGQAPSNFTITSTPWGSVSGSPVNLYTLGNGKMSVNISNYGGIVQSITVPDRNGNPVDVALGFPNLQDYVNDFTQGASQTSWPLPGGSGDTYFGSTVGRYANRIADASFSLNGKTYTLDANNGTNTLHGGYLGWNTVVWTPSTSTSWGGATLTLTHDFPAGEGCLPSLSPGCTGFPAPVAATVTFTVTPDNQLKIGYSIVNQSKTDATVVNPTNHTYFNLAGEGSGTVENQLLAINADDYTPVNTNLIPEAPYFVPVAGTPYDFRSLTPIGQNLRATNLPDGTSGPYKQLQIAHGFDNNWVLNGYPGYRLVAVAENPGNGITLWEYTDQPGVQMYTGNFLVGDLIGTSGKTYRQTDGFTLETQHYPDSPHHIGDPSWPSVVLNPGATFTSTTAYGFSDAGGWGPQAAQQGQQVFP